MRLKPVMSHTIVECYKSCITAWLHSHPYVNGYNRVLTYVVVPVVECPNKLPPSGHLPLTVDSSLQICREVTGP